MTPTIRFRKTQELVHDLAQKAAQLDRLLADPHPGLFSWGMMANAKWNDVRRAMIDLDRHIEDTPEDKPRDPVLFGG